MIQTVREPDQATALQFLQSELQGLQQKRGHLVQVVGDCEVAYQGRARSTLQRGERLLVLKPDGTLLVHTAKKAKPVNWQPPGAGFDVAMEDDQIILTAIRTKPEEMVRVVFHEIMLMVAVPLRDEADLSLMGSEADLQQLLFDNPDLVEPGFIPQRRERDSKRGFYDLDGRDAAGNRLIVEVKRGTAGISEAQQLWRYVEEHDGVRGMLIAPRVAAKARAMLETHGLSWRELTWEDLMPRIEAMRKAGQSSLGKWS